MKATPKKTSLYIAGICLLTLAILVFVQAAFNLSPVIDPSEPDQILLLYTLSTFIFLVLLVFAFVLSRTLIKVWVERKQQKPGSQFKTSLLVWLILLTLVPATLLFVFAFGLVNRSIDKWFSVPADQAFRAAAEITRQWRAEHEEIGRTILNHLAQQRPLDIAGARRNFQLKALLVLDSRGNVLEGSADPEVAESRLAEQVSEELGDRDELMIDAGPSWIAARRIHEASAFSGQPLSEVDGPGILAAVFYTPERLLELNNEIALQRANYDELVQNRKAYRDTYVYILLLMTVLVLFAAVWIGLFLSKRITVPIEALSVATREISAGNLDHRVDIRAEDELGLLVRLFNDMADQLQGTTRELEARRRYMEIILESIPTGVISLDADLRVNKINRAASAMFSAGTAATLEEIFTGEDLRAIQQVLRDTGAAAVTREIVFRTPGRPAHSAVTATRLAAGGFVLVVEDLTEVVRAQKASAWREVARRLAHEIKNPLTPIQLSAERISRNVARLPAPSPRIGTIIDECVEAIVSEVSSLKNLVDEFVRFARLPAVSRAPGSMQELVARTMTLYEDRLNGVRVSLDVPADLPPVLMDSLQMKRVLINLIDNALEALSGQAQQELRIACEPVRDRTMVRLTVADTGRGIAPEDRERLFGPYFSTRKNGTGLGLAIASRIVADHGGYIGAEANSAGGARFVIELPICHESSLSMTNLVSGSR